MATDKQRRIAKRRRQLNQAIRVGKRGRRIARLQNRIARAMIAWQLGKLNGAERKDFP